jgi:hypothetical protein
VNFLYFPDEINITKITGTGQVKEGEPVTVNVTFNGR